jgi:hypothetical protein
VAVQQTIHASCHPPHPDNAIRAVESPSGRSDFGVQDLPISPIDEMSYPDQPRAVETAATIEPHTVNQILSHLSLESAEQLPAPPIDFLKQHISRIPPSLLWAFNEPITSSRERSSIREVKARRMLFAEADGSRARQLTAEEGWRRWPLLWESFGGDPLGPKRRIEDSFGELNQDEASGMPNRSIPTLSGEPSTAKQPSEPSFRMREESTWATNNFMPTDATPAERRKQVLQVNKLGKFLAELEEEREWEDMRDAKRLERRRNQEEEAGKEEFEESSDEDEEEEDPRMVGQPAEDQEEVKVLFERRLLEIFLDGLDVGRPRSLRESNSPCSTSHS